MKNINVAVNTFPIIWKHFSKQKAHQRKKDLFQGLNRAEETNQPLQQHKPETLLPPPTEVPSPMCVRQVANSHGFKHIPKN